MCLDIGPLGILHKWMLEGNAGVWNDDIEAVDTVLPRQLNDGAKGVLLDRSLVLHYDQTAVLALWKISEGQGGRVRRVSISRNDGLLYVS